MKAVDCQFVVASGNQYYQLRSLFPNYYDELSFVAENGAFVKDIICQIKRDKTFHLRNSKKLLMVFGNLVIF